MVYHLAQLNLGSLVDPIGRFRESQISSRNLPPINALAEAAPGFVWRLPSSYGDAMDIADSDDPSINVNMSVWESSRRCATTSMNRIM